MPTGVNPNNLQSVRRWVALEKALRRAEKKPPHPAAPAADDNCLDPIAGDSEVEGEMAITGRPGNACPGQAASRTCRQQDLRRAAAASIEIHWCPGVSWRYGAHGCGPAQPDGRGTPFFKGSFSCRHSITASSFTDLSCTQVLACLLTTGHDSFHEEAREVLRAGHASGGGGSPVAAA
jgi:hypothetical protein